MTDENGKPLDKTYLEHNLPENLAKSVERMKIVWKLIDADEKPSECDMDWCELNADINIAENNDDISSEQAWYLREKYLRMQKPDPHFLD